MKKQPPLERINAIDKSDSLLDAPKIFKGLDQKDKYYYLNETVIYSYYSTLVESKVMLIINYLAALLLKGRNNKVSIHHNHQNDMELIEVFEEENKETLTKLKKARNTVYSHMDPKQASSGENITFVELEKCINFLNDLLKYNFKYIRGILDKMI